MSAAINNLLQILREDYQYHVELVQVLENKLDAMRHYDMSRLEALGQQEQRLTQAVALNGQKRVATVTQAAYVLIPGAANKGVRASELAAAMQLRPELSDQAEQLSTLVSLLKAVTEKIQRLNQINNLATRKILGHFDQIFRIIAQNGRDIGLYGRGGKKTYMEQNRLVDARA